jgi:antirestriction protein ArdC
VEDHRLIARMYFLFHAAQVDGWAEPDRSLHGVVAAHEEVDNFIAATGADIRCGDIAAYLRASDYITIPRQEQFVGSKTSSPTESYYSTVFHELIHWTGHGSRLGRNLSGRFGTHDYAMEELVAELGAAYLCAEFLVLHMPRNDHAAYIADWLDVLKGDKRAIFTASSAALRAVEYLLTA